MDRNRALLGVCHVTSMKTARGGDTAATIDRITRSLLEQLELQSRAALTLLEQAPLEQREAFLAKIAEARGRLVRLRAVVLGSTAPVLVSTHPSRDTKTAVDAPGAGAEVSSNL